MSIIYRFTAGPNKLALIKTIKTLNLRPSKLKKYVRIPCQDLIQILTLDWIYKMGKVNIWGGKKTRIEAVTKEES